jgi:hypothetical protein
LDFSPASIKEATALWVMAKLISPQEFKVLFNIGTCLLQMNNQKEALEYFNEAKIIPSCVVVSMCGCWI